MTYTTTGTHTTSAKTKSHGGYRNLVSYQTATIIYDLTVTFVNHYIERSSRTRDQMVQAARSGRQNIAEGSQASGTSAKTEIKLVGVARASLEELLVDYEDFLRQHILTLWEKNSSKAQEIRALSYKSNRSYSTYKSYLGQPEAAANCLICLIHQANFLLDKQLMALEEKFLNEGGYTENLFKRRMARRR
ncbi:MAG: four helix bundle suffix domain-containing protein [Candidatus Levyibacteriota bacterium]